MRNKGMAWRIEYNKLMIIDLTNKLLYISSIRFYVWLPFYSSFMYQILVDS